MAGSGETWAGRFVLQGLRGYTVRVARRHPNTRRPTKPRRKKLETKVVEQTPAEKAGLTEPQYLFCLTYISNGFNASAAARAAYPNQTEASARVQGCENLTKPNIRAFISSRLEDAWRDKQMSGDECLARVAGDARADIRLLFDKDGKLRNPHEWPDEIADSIEAVDLANGKIKLASKTIARRTILEQTGKLRSPADAVDKLAELMRGDLERNRKLTAGA